MRNGTRLYLLPNTLNTEELEVMKAYLQESVTVKPEIYKPISQKIRNLCSRFTNRLDQYLLGQILFLMVQTSENPVIFVSTPENLYFMESANLVVSGYNGLF